jgi:hypothetical protein
MWILLFTFATAVAICLSVAAILMQSVEGGRLFTAKRPKFQYVANAHGSVIDQGVGHISEPLQAGGCRSRHRSRHSHHAVAARNPSRVPSPGCDQSGSGCTPRTWR